MRLLSWLWVGLPVVGIAELGGQLWASQRAPDLGEWRAVAKEVREAKAPEAVVVVSPRWAEPLARAALGDELMPLRDVARPGLDGYHSALEISIVGSSDPELSNWSVTESRKSGRFSLRVLSNPEAPRVQLDFVDALSEAVVTETSGSDQKPCKWSTRNRPKSGGLGGNPTYPRKRFSCPSGEPYIVGVTVIDDADDRPRRCIHAYPTPNGPLTLEFGDVPLGAELRGHAGLPHLMVRNGGGAPVKLEVHVNDKLVGTHVQEDLMGWTGFRFPTGASPGKRGKVQFRVSSTSVGNRHFCFAADMR